MRRSGAFVHTSLSLGRSTRPSPFTGLNDTKGASYASSISSTFSSGSSAKASKWREVEALRSLRQSLGIAEGDLEAWYKVSNKEISRCLGSSYGNLFGNSRAKLLAALDPNHPWDPSKFLKKPKKFLQSKANQRILLNEIGEKLGIKLGDFDLWYKVTVSDLKRAKGMTLLQFFSNSISKMLASLIPEHKWDLSRFKNKPMRFWASKEVQRGLLLELGKKLGISEGDFEAWYKVTSLDLLKIGGAPVLSLYRRSMSSTLSSVFPEYSWDKSQFIKKPHRYWDLLEAQRVLLDSVGQKLGIKSGDLESWYRFTSTDLQKNGAGPLFSIHGRSISKLLSVCYPEYPWDPSKFAMKPKTFWDSKERQREKLLEIATKLGFKIGDYESWYEISNADMIRLGGGQLLSHYGDSARLVMTSLFPEHDWSQEKFRFSRLKGGNTDPSQILLRSEQ